MNKNKASVTYNKIVNVAEDGEISVLDGVFAYRNMSGATGSRFYAVSTEQLEEATTLKAIEERLRDCVNDNEVPLQYREHERGYYKNPYKRWAQAIINAGEEIQFAFDTSYSELWDYMREELGLSEDEACIFECVGGGRMFDKTYVGNKSEWLSAIIRKYESWNH